MTMRLLSLPPGTRGFDCNTVVSATMAQAFLQHPRKYRFVVRYVRRSQRNSFDISPTELQVLTEAGLAVQLVQHVAREGWLPDGNLGMSYGEVAAAEAEAVGYLPGAHLACDLEGVSRSARHEDVRQFCNTWYDAVLSAGYLPMLYVGDSCILSAAELYSLKFMAYWSAYNLNRDQYPAVRSVMMRQLPYPPPSERVPGCPFEYDEDIVTGDLKGSLPVMVAA